MPDTAADYRVKLDVFDGPLDLLLYLVKRDELDIFDVPIARVAKSYAEHLNVLRMLNLLDLDETGDFLVMAATLAEIKSASLLPRPPEVPPDANDGSATAALVDPRGELIRQLLEYKKLKDGAGALLRLRTEHEQRFPRFPARREPGEDDAPPLDLDEVQVWDLFAAFSKLTAETTGSPRARRGRPVHEVVDDDTPLELHAADVEDRLRRDGALTLRALFANRAGRGEVIGVFLAVLELVRQRRVIARFADDAGEEIELAALENQGVIASPV